MANSKHAHIRYNFLDYCFRYKSFTFNELLSFLNEKIANALDIEINKLLK